MRSRAWEADLQDAAHPRGAARQNLPANDRLAEEPARVQALARAQGPPGDYGLLRERYREGMEDQLGALGLVLNCVVLWNTIYMDKARAQRQAAGRPIPDEILALVAARSSTSTSTSQAATPSTCLSSTGRCAISTRPRTRTPESSQDREDLRIDSVSRRGGRRTRHRATLSANSCSILPPDPPFASERRPGSAAQRARSWRPRRSARRSHRR